MRQLKSLGPIPVCASYLVFLSDTLLKLSSIFCVHCQFSQFIRCAVQHAVLQCYTCMEAFVSIRIITMETLFTQNAHCTQRPAGTGFALTVISRIYAVLAVQTNPSFDGHFRQTKSLSQYQVPVPCWMLPACAALGRHTHRIGRTGRAGAEGQAGFPSSKHGVSPLKKFF